MTAVIAFFAGPLGRWILIGALLTAAIVAAGAHQRSIGAKNEADRIYTELAKQEKAYLALVAKKQKALDALQVKYAALTEQRERELTDAERKRLDDLDALRKRMPKNVPQNSKLCPSLPAGYIMHRADSAAYANGAETAPAPEASPDALDADSGVSLPAIAETDAGQAGAYRACTARNASWLKYHADVEAWAAEVKRIVEATE